MKGTFSNSPFSSNVARMSSRLRTSIQSPAFSFLFSLDRLLFMLGFISLRIRSHCLQSFNLYPRQVALSGNERASVPGDHFPRNLPTLFDHGFGIQNDV